MLNVSSALFEGVQAFGETTFEAAASRMVPTSEYAITGNVDAHTKFSVAPDGRVYLGNFSIYAGPEHHPHVATGSDIQPGVLLFDPKRYVGWWPAAGSNFSDTKTSVVGRYTRALTVTAWDVTAQRGFSLVVVPNTDRGIRTQPYSTAELLVRLEEASPPMAPTSTNAYDGGTASRFAPPKLQRSAPLPRYFAVQGCVIAGSAVDNATTTATTKDGSNRSVICARAGYCKPVVRCQGKAAADAVVELTDGGALFHAHLLVHGTRWVELFEGEGGGYSLGRGHNDNSKGSSSSATAHGVASSSASTTGDGRKETGKEPDIETGIGARSTSVRRGGRNSSSSRTALLVSLRYAPGEAARLVDMARGTMAAALTTFLGARPNYGDGGTYWSVAEADRGALPLESFALDHALLLWGLPDQAGTRVEFYLRHYVRAANGMVPEREVSTNASAGPPGSIDLKHWNDECVFADSLADYGRWIELWVDVARAKGARFDLLLFVLVGVRFGFAQSEVNPIAARGILVDPL
jgi:hypothetical protein